MNYKQYLNDFEKNIDNIVLKTINNIRSFVKANNIKRFVIGMSGGIDCAVTASFVKKAGIEVIALTMPYEANKSLQREHGKSDAVKQCEVLNIPILTIDITKTVNSVLENYIMHKDVINSYIGAKDLAKANVLPRIRMTNLYYVAQSIGALVLGTGNLSEYTMGYFTKWGDGGYDYNPIKDFTKTEIYMLAKKLDIIDEIQTKKPSADLWDGQTDEDEMHVSYDYIDQYIRAPEEENPYKDIILKAIKSSMHKKKQ